MGWFDFFVWWHINFLDSFNAQTIPLEKQRRYYLYLTHNWEDKSVDTFPKGICPKVKIIVRLEFKLAY